MTAWRGARGRLLAGLLVLVCCGAAEAAAQEPPALPALTEPVNDFASALDASSKAEIDRVIRALQARTGDTVVVATVQSVEPFGDIREYAVRLFENRGRGLGNRDRDNGLLVLLSVGDRKVWIEVGYGLEGAITDGFAGETSREYMIPFFRQERYGQGLLAGVTRLAGRIAEDRGTTLDGVPPPRAAQRERRERGLPVPMIVFLALMVLFVMRQGRRGRRRRRYWTGGPWSGWSGGVGPFGGHYGGWSGGGFGGFGGGGGGGGFGGFGGGRSGGGGGGGGW